MGAPAHLDHGRIPEVSGEGVHVDGGAGDDELEPGALLEHALQIAEQEVDVEASLVGLIDYEAVIAREPLVPADLGEQQAIGDELDTGPLADHLAETHRVAHLGAQRHGQLLGDPGRDGSSRQAAGLSVTDHARATQPRGQTDLGQLGSLA